VKLKTGIEMMGRNRRVKSLKIALRYELRKNFLFAKSKPMILACSKNRMIFGVNREMRV
jgi:hypothetical protein